MPVYQCSISASRVDDAKRQQIASEITRIHCFDPSYVLYDAESLVVFSRTYRSWGPFWHRSDLMPLAEHRLLQVFGVVPLPPPPVPPLASVR